jgi:hypothetical protein
MTKSIKSCIYEKLVKILREEFNELQVIDRYRNQYNQPEKHTFEGLTHVFIDFATWEFMYGGESFGEEIKVNASIDFYLGVVNYADSYSARQINTNLHDKSSNFDSSLSDFDMEQKLFEILNKRAGECGFRQLFLKRSTEFLNNTALIVFKIETETEVCYNNEGICC